MLHFLIRFWNWLFCIHRHTKHILYYEQHYYDLYVYEESVCEKCGYSNKKIISSYSLADRDAIYIKQDLQKKGIKNREDLYL